MSVAEKGIIEVLQRVPLEQAARNIVEHWGGTISDDDDFYKRARDTDRLMMQVREGKYGQLTVASVRPTSAWGGPLVTEWDIVDGVDVMNVGRDFFAAAFGLPVTEGELSPQAVRQLLSDNFNVVVDADETVPLVIEAVGRVFVDKQIGRRKDIIEDELDDEDY